MSLAWLVVFVGCTGSIEGGSDYGTDEHSDSFGHEASESGTYPKGAAATPDGAARPAAGEPATDVAASAAQAHTAPQQGQGGAAGTQQAQGDDAAGGGAGRTQGGSGGVQGHDTSSDTSSDDTSSDDTGGADAGSDDTGDDGDCFDATRLWFEDFETGDYRRWTSKTYNADWGNDCQDNQLSTETAHSASHSQRSEITCAYTSEGNVQRGYGGLQFSGDAVVPAYTNKGVGLDAPHGVVTTMWMRLDSPTVFQDGKWVNFWTSAAECDWSGNVLTLGLEDSSDKLAAAHYDTRKYVQGAPSLPRGRWVRVTVYVNYYSGIMHVWQDGVSQQHVTFQRDVKTICQWHWGLYGSGDNDDVVLFEDDKSLWKLNQDWTDWTTEPYFGHDVGVCQPPS